MWGYWGQLPPPDVIATTQEAERLGFDSVWTAEAWGSDAFTPLAWIAGHTSTIKLGTSVVQIAARTPTATAMGALTLDHISNGRMMLGLGVSGPQVVEGWYGRPANKPLARTREYVEIIRRVLRREEPLDFQGEFFQHPYRGPDSTGFGKPLKAITHPTPQGPPDLPRRRGPEERGDGSRDRGRMAAALLLAAAPGRLRRLVAGRQARLRHRGGRAGEHQRRRRGRARAGEDDARLLHRRHGRQGPELPHQADGSVRLRGRRR